jgi:hypothetical protein
MKRGPFLVGWSCRVRTRDFCSALAALVGPVQNIFSSPYTISIPLSPSPCKLGRKPCWEACLLVCVSAYTISLPLSPLPSKLGSRVGSLDGLLSLNPLRPTTTFSSDFAETFRECSARPHENFSFFTFFEISISFREANFVCFRPYRIV